VEAPPKTIAEKTTPKAEEMQIVPPPTVEQVQPSAQETQLLPSSAEQTEESDAPVIPASPLTPNEADPGNLERYLVNLNRCAVEDLQTIEGIGPALAKRIIEFRDARGHFSSLEELRQIPGIGRKTFRALTGAEPRALNRLLGADHNRELSLQEVVRLTNTLPGITGCMLAMSNGLFLTGELPPQFDRETISVFAPQLFKKVGHYTRELRVGQIRRFTIFTDQQPLSIFRAGDVYLIVIHDTRHFSKALLRRCERISQEIARLCRQRAVV
jgi:competence ComEA-like helix-hairpin-helix protein